MQEYGRESLRKVGYDAIHPGSRGRAIDFNQMEDEKGYSMPEKRSRAEVPMKSYTEKYNRSAFETEPRFDDDYSFPLEGGARREPLVKIPFNDNLLHDY